MPSCCYTFSLIRKNDILYIVWVIISTVCRMSAVSWFIYKCWNLLLTLLLHDTNKFSVFVIFIRCCPILLFVYVKLNFFHPMIYFILFYLLFLSHHIIFYHIIMFMQRIIHEYINMYTLFRALYSYEKKRKKKIGKQYFPARHICLIFSFFVNKVLVEHILLIVHYQTPGKRKIL